MTFINCKICGKEFKQRHKKHFLCSKNCQKELRKIKNRRKKIYIHKFCKVCNKEFFTTFKRQIFCSYTCQDIAYKDYNKEYKLKNMEKLKERSHSPERKEQQNKTNKLLRKKHRDIVFEHYAGNPPKCACCGESEYYFLTIDHIDGGARRDNRLKIRPNSGHSLWRWLIQHNFPEGFQVLCYNCNCGRGRFKDGICPHKREEI